MKIIGRTLIILAVFSALSGLMVLAVNASGTSAAPAGFNDAPSQFRPEGDGDGDEIRPEGGEFRPEHGGRGGAGGSRWVFGLVKNVGVMAVLVALIVLPRNLAKKKRKQAIANSVSGET
jgi:hypothetical protein